MAMTKKEFAKELEKRTRKFAVQIIQMSASLTNSPESKVIRNQVTKSATSVGANYREANRPISKADFKNKVKICASETSETQYWLKVIAETGWSTWEKVKNAYDESSELVAISTASGKNMRSS